MPNLTVAISAHGYGHAAQTAPVVEALASMIPDLRVTLHSDLPASVLREFFPMARGVTSPLIDLGMRMSSSFDVDRRKTADLYTALHVDFPRSVASEADRLARSAPDLVLANISYLALAAAARLGVPAVALGSLTWFHMFAAYCSDKPGAHRILREMLDAYRAASLFIAPAPAMPMPELATVLVGPVARLANDDARSRLVRAVGSGEQERLVLVSLGGIGHKIAVANWPETHGVRYILPGLTVPDRRHIVPLDLLKIDHLDCLAGCDALVTKPGYGSVTEATCHGVPIVFARRGDWPDESSILDWVADRGVALEVARTQLEQGAIAGALEHVWSLPRKEPVNPTGNLNAAEKILPFLVGQ